MKRDNYLQNWQRSGHNNPKDLSRFVIKNDRWDREDFAGLIKEMKEFRSARDKLSQSAAGDAAYDAWQDVFLSAYKVNPKQFDRGEIRPDHLVTAFVMDEVEKLPEHRRMRQWTQGDLIGAAMAANTMEPEISSIYNRLQEQMEQAKQLQEEMQKLAQAMSDLRTAEEIYKDWIEQGGDPESEEGQDLQQAVQNAQDAANQAQSSAEAQAQSLEQSLKDAEGAVRDGLRSAINEANEQADASNTMSEAFGMEPGSLQKLPAQQRIELAKKLSSPRMRRIAALFGPMKRLAFTEQRRKVNYAPEEVYDVELGDNLERVLMSEKMQLRHPQLRLIFRKNLLERRLLQYKMRGYEKVGKGGIIYCEDGSGSMSGDREIWAKALGLVLMQIAREQKRSFYAIHFGSPREIAVMDFRNPADITPESVIQFAELFFGGGTDFQTPMAQALKIMREEHETHGMIRSDIVFATDGYCDVHPNFMKEWKEEQERLGFKLYGVNIGGDPKAEPLHSMSDGKVATVKSLVNGENVKDIFGSL